MRTRRLDANHPSEMRVVIVGSLAIALAWIFTPRYGPWACQAIAASICLLGAFFFGSTDRKAGWTKRVAISGIVLGGFLAVMSWACAPIAARILPVINNDMRQLYAALNRAPGPVKSLPILVLTVIAEELVWRRELVTWLLRRFRTFGTVVITTVSYAIPIAASKSPLLIAVAVCFGILFTLQRLIFRSWLAPLIAHLVWAILVLVAFPLV
jgi:membrane protease YdiL (CAAX protease family)